MKYCRQCHRALHTLSTCGNFVTCPAVTGGDFSEVHPHTDVLIVCESCDKAVAMSVWDILCGKAKAEFKCPRSHGHCDAHTVRPAESALAAPQGVVGRSQGKTKPKAP